MNIRDEVQWFASEMEQKLRQNDHKSHWSECTFSYLYSRLLEEAKELGESLVNHNLSPSEETKNRVVDETVDVANFAMMIADIVWRNFQMDDSNNCKKEGTA